MTTVAGRRSRIKEEPHGATFVELFFDLVFVYAVTQVTALLVEDLTWSGAARAAVVAWLVWWAWQQFVWSLSPADTTHPAVEIGVLLAAAVAFFMARAVPDSFLGNPWFFVVPYLAVRAIGMGLYAWVGGADRTMRRAMGLFGAASLPAAAALVVGATLDVSVRAPVWGIALVLDLAAGVVARRVDWRVHVSHFAERHGLFVIIALGESLIAIGVASAPLDATVRSFTTKGVGVALVCALWWLYFGWFKQWLEEQVERRAASEGGIDLIRNSYSFLHFPIVAGVIAIAAGLEEVVAHPVDRLSPAGSIVLALGAVLYAGAMIVLAGMVGRLVLVPRTGLTIVIAGVVLAGGAVSGIAGWVVVGVAAGVAALIGAVEYPGPSPAGADG